MVAGTIRHSTATEGVRPINLARDWRQVLTLIREAFGDTLDVEAQQALQHMQPPRLLIPILGVLDSLSPPGEGMMPGFVWVRGTQIVGTASVRRISTQSRGWLISNVAVHPKWQGHGFGRALLEACIDFAEQSYGAWVTLQVRESNRAAQQLYHSLGFRSVGAIVRWRNEKPPAPSWNLSDALRPAGWFDGGALSRLAQTIVPHDMLWADLLSRKLYQTDPFSHSLNRLRGRRNRWWVQDGFGHNFRAAVGIHEEKRLPWRRLRLLIPPERQDQRLSTNLIYFGLRQLTQISPLPVEIEYPASDKATCAALEGTGFEPTYSLIHLRLDLA